MATATIVPSKRSGLLLVRVSFRPFIRSLPTVVLSCAVLGMAARAAQATDLKPETLAAFDRYIAATDSQMNDSAAPDKFLIVDRLPEPARRAAYEQLRGGQPYIEEVSAEENHHPIAVPGGLIHDWAGVIFIPKATLSQADAALHDYENEPAIYKPDVRQARLIKQDGNQSKIFEQFYSKTLVTVVLNAYFDVLETRLGPTRIQSVSRSTRIAEVLDFDSPDERERTDGKDHGYMWRLNSYWRLEEKDGGVYIQNESISLSRTVPVMFAWLINPLTKSIPREVLYRTLTNTRRAIEMSKTASKPESVR